jgi:hypothetical protein
MPYASEDLDGLHVVRVRGETSAAEMRQRFRFIERMMVPGPALALIVYEKHCRYLGSPQETMLIQFSLAEALKGSLGGALAFVCAEDALYGICRQFQMIASLPALKIGVFREMDEAREWLATEGQGIAAAPSDGRLS